MSPRYTTRLDDIPTVK
ncbi:DUF4113 domain-containing protein [Pantoea vagans]|nr:DUF4113 domain-containing protein [Pantoea vagans]